MCWLCDASKGMDPEGDLDMSITNCGHDASWWNTLGTSNPWSVVPNFAKITGFEIGMVMPDLLHCWNLGVARYMLASSLKIVLGERHVYPQSTLAERLAMASVSLRLFAKQRQLPLRMKRITKKKRCSGSPGAIHKCLVVAMMRMLLQSGWNMNYNHIRTCTPRSFQCFGRRTKLSV